MSTYRIVTREGHELATVQAANLAEVIASAPASVTPVEAQIVAADSLRVLARLELWAGDHPGWALVAAAPETHRTLDVGSVRPSRSS